MKLCICIKNQKFWHLQILYTYFKQNPLVTQKVRHKAQNYTGVPIFSRPIVRTPRHTVPCMLCQHTMPYHVVANVTVARYHDKRSLIFGYQKTSYPNLECIRIRTLLDPVFA